MPRSRFTRALAALCFLVLLAGAARTSAQPALTPVELSFHLHVAARLPAHGELLLRPLDSKAEPLRREVVPGSPVSLSLPAGSRWEVAGEFPGFWLKREPLEVGSPEKPVRLSLDLWPLGTVTGNVRVKGGKLPLPKQVLVRSLAAPSFLHREPAPQGAIDSPLSKTGTWSSSLPAARYDLVLSASGFAPAYRWGVEVPVQRTLPLGTIELQPGASVAGWLVVEGGALDPERCLARLTPSLAAGVDRAGAAQAQRAAFAQKVAKDGFFQLTGLPGGTFDLEIEQPGFPPARLSRLRIDPGAETLLREPLVLRHPVDLAFEVHPAADWLGRPWRAQVVRLGEKRPNPLVFDGAADAEGLFRVTGQPAGRFRVQLRDSLGNTLAWEEVAWDGSDAAPHALEVHFITVEGRLRLGKEPLSATLWFGGHAGTRSAKMESDGEGKFHGVLPSEGPWRIEIEAPQPGFPTWARTQVRANRAGLAHVDVDLPATRLFGRVVDPQGKPVAKALVSAAAESADLVTPSGVDGGFEFRALPEGIVALGAESSSGVSGRTLVPLAEGRDAGPIELRLQATRKVRGVVLSPRGPVAGAQVMLFALAPFGGGAAGTSGPDGAFEVDLPQGVSTVVAVASAPGFALRATEVQLTEAPVSLQVSEEGGDLEIVLPLGAEAMQAADLFLAFYQNGLPLPAVVFGNWLRDQAPEAAAVGASGAEGKAERPIRIPHVAPGDYRLCLLPKSLQLAASWGIPPPEAPCAEGVLRSGATLTLKLPAPR